MNELIVATYKLPADDRIRKLYGDNLEYVYDSVAFHNDNFGELELKRLKRKYGEVDSFVCNFASYYDWVDNDEAYKEFTLTGVCPLKPMDEDVDVGTDSKTVTIKCKVMLRREDSLDSFDYKVDIDDVGQIVFTPSDVGTRFCDLVDADDTVNTDENTKIETVTLTTQMISESGNYDYFVGTDDVGQFVITPDVDDTAFLTVSVEDSLNLVTESTTNIVVESSDTDCEDQELTSKTDENCEEDNMKILKESNKYRDFEWEDELYAVVKNNGEYAGVPCRSYEEAKQLSYHPGSKIFKLVLADDSTEDPLEEELSDKDHMDIVNKVMRGELPVFSDSGEPDPTYIPIPELSSTHGKLAFDYYYDEKSGEVVSYSRPLED